MRWLALVLLIGGCRSAGGLGHGIDEMPAELIDKSDPSVDTSHHPVLSHDTASYHPPHDDRMPYWGCLSLLDGCAVAGRHGAGLPAPTLIGSALVVAHAARRRRRLRRSYLDASRAAP